MKSAIAGRSFIKYASYDPSTNMLGHVYDHPKQVEMCYFNGIKGPVIVVEVKVRIMKMVKT